MSALPYASLAEIYEAIRPSYPDELISDVITHSQIPQDAHLMEIGAGTGKATACFLRRGYHVDANELDPAMADILSEKCASKKMTLTVGPFETWAPPQSCYDLIYCAQAFHWLDPDIKFEKCRGLLSEGGHLALIWYDPQSAPDTPAYRAAQAVRENYFGPEDMTVSVPMNTRLQEMDVASDFVLCFQKEYPVTIYNTPHQSLLAMQSTPAFSERFSQFPVEKQTAFIREYTAAIEENGGVLEAPMLFSLYILTAI